MAVSTTIPANITSISALTAGPYSVTNAATSVSTGSSYPTMEVKGEMRISGNVSISGSMVTVNGSLEDRIAKIEERMAILHPNKFIENKFEELRLAGEHYRKLEAEFKEQLELEKILKS